jgi:sigma-B regulation protein RsbU (phosphoserine phosphatase)
VHQFSSHYASNPRVLTRWDHAGFHVSAERRGVGGSIGGGDFYTLAVRAPGHIGVVIGDACGRGVDGEAQLSKILPTIHELALSGAPPAELLGELNSAVASKLPADRFVTAAAFEFDMRAGVLTVANAAHVPAIVRRARDRHVSVIGRASGIPLGILPNTTYLAESYELDQGDVVVLMSDGVLEAVESDLTSMSTLQQFLSDAQSGAVDVHRLLLQKFEECTTGARADDMTLMVLEATPEPISGDLLGFARTG